MWTDILPLMLRHVINDVDTPQTYTDNRLQLALLVGAQFVTAEVNLSQKYQLDFIQVSINPDPTSQSAPDEWMMNLMVMRSSIMMLSNNLKVAANSAWVIKDTDMTADLRKVADVNKQLLDEIKGMYDHAKAEYMVGVNPQVSAVLTPFNVLAGGFRGPIYGYGTRDQLIW